MKWLVVGVLLVSVVLPASGCTEDKCKNPARTQDDTKSQGRVEGPAMKCNTVVTCPGNGGRPDNKFLLQGGDDPTIVDRNSASWNESRCKEKVQRLEWINPKCTFEFSPELICLDADGGSGAPSPTPTGGTLVTVGVGAGSGDYWITEQGAGGGGGAGGAGGFSEEPGEAGHGGQ